MNFVLDNNEAIIIKKNICYKNSSKVLLSVTSKRLIFEKKKIFFNKYKVIDEIMLDDIIFYKDKVQIKQRNKTLIIQTTKRLITIKTNSIVDATKIKEAIINAKTESSLIERTSVNFKKIVNKTKKITGEAVLLGVSIFGIAKNSKVIYENGKKVIKYITKLFIK